MKTILEKSYDVNYFDSHNTSFKRKYFNWNYQKVKDHAKEMCRKYYKIVIENNNGFEEFQKGEMISWSYPNGCGQIKINS